MDSAERALVAGVHRLQHVESLPAAAFADDDAVRPHPECVLDKLLRRDLPASLDARGFRLEAHDVRLLQPKLGRVFDRDDPLALRNEGRERIELRRLSRPRAAGDDDVPPDSDTGGEEEGGLIRQATDGDQVFHPHLVLLELADGDGRRLWGDRRDDDVDARAVRKAGVDHRRRLVDAPAER